MARSRLVELVVPSQSTCTSSSNIVRVACGCLVFPSFVFATLDVYCLYPSRNRTYCLIMPTIHIHFGPISHEILPDQLPPKYYQVNAIATGESVRYALAYLGRVNIPLYSVIMANKVERGTDQDTIESRVVALASRSIAGYDPNGVETSEMHSHRLSAFK